MKTGVAFILFILLAVAANAQYTDTTQHYLKLLATGSVNRTDETENYLLNNSARFGLRKKRVGMNTGAAWVYGEQNNILSNNDFNGWADMNWYPHRSKNFYYWALANYTASYSLKINSQYQAGGGVAYSIINRDSLYLNVSDGLLYEYSDLQLSDTTVEMYNTVRNSFRLWFRFKYRNMISFDGGSFLQHSLKDGNDYIIRSSAALDFRLGWGFSLRTSLTYNKFNRTEKENLLLNYGLIYEKYF
ncbi:DUF481 domain-containing protein [Polluticoccus soli]|uniref:DUF481 domain-containing protein n=1 Tax=Polluticoccus soli TaxID=3034150 RepID=UPI0023E1359B|nr:DUF481 domain-containing protein [Flavipsychrobacter sp. JY13-12]